MPRVLLIISILFIAGLACRNGATTGEPSAGNNTAVERNSPEPGAGDSGRTGDSRTIAGGVLNDEAVEIPQPPYPPTARAVRASGKVVVNIEVAPDGSVVKAVAESGHPLLKAAAVAAARQAKFKPGPSPISGSLEYEFTAP
jgi:TonB family protein